MIASLVLTSLLTFVELNCENLFDCQHDSLKQDTEFLPTSGRHWTRTRYWRKLDRLSKELMACGDTIGGFTPPDLVALCEVENDTVMRDLTKRSPLRTADYDYLMTNSPDVRGIDVALMYHRFSFAPITHRSLRITPDKGMRPTRDVLYVSGRIVSGDTLHIFVLHAPSRLGGERHTRGYRKNVGATVLTVVDSIRNVSPQAKIIVAGDFNDGEQSHSLEIYRNSGLTCAADTATGRNGAKGTYRYRGHWETLDHLLVSESLRPNVLSSRIFDAPFLLTDEPLYGGVKPRRCYPSYRYDPEGFSDHLPLIVRFRF